MKNLRKKILTMACVTGMIGLGYAMPAKAFESKIDTNSPVVNTEEGWYQGVTPEHKRVITKTLKNGVEIKIYYNSKGKIDHKGIYQWLPDGNSIIEGDRDCDGEIDYRVTFNKEGPMLYEYRSPGGSVEKVLIK